MYIAAWLQGRGICIENLTHLNLWKLNLSIKEFFLFCLNEHRADLPAKQKLISQPVWDGIFFRYLSIQILHVLKWFCFSAKTVKTELVQKLILVLLLNFLSSYLQNTIK